MVLLQWRAPWTRPENSKQFLKDHAELCGQIERQIREATLNEVAVAARTNAAEPDDEEEPDFENE